MSETKKPADPEAKPTTDQELSEEQLEQVAGGALNAYIKGEIKLETTIGSATGGAGLADKLSS
jgi:hypothetical protein